jgi:hypothetical protein
MVVFGARLYGKVHAVPGVFYISTRFLHLFFVPIIPTSSWVILDTTKPRSWFSSQRTGLELKCIRWGSVVMAWLRLLLLLLAAMSIIVAATLVGLSAHVLRITSCAVFGFSCLAALIYSYRTSRATLADLDKLSRVPGVPAELLAGARVLLSRGTKVNKPTSVPPSAPSRSGSRAVNV